MRRTEWHQSIDSTMHRAAELAAEGCPAGTIVGADIQTAGQGRLGRTWHSNDGGLYFTMILRPKVEMRDLPMVTMASGVAVADALQMFAGVSVDLRWPNDVMVGERKLVGILAQWHAGAVLAGIGLNVSQSAFPDDVKNIATSLARETDRIHNKQVLLKAIAASVETHVEILETSGVTAILRLFANASSYVSGKRVKVELPGGDVVGTTAGLTPDGFLLLRKDDGEEITITAGGLRPV
ncbi:biotin--[acetyl-CoA-carboxylase] ligase [Paludibaculum fermentans]|uniref:biotin--[biotin carboxyl-carrier protein] ligase n=1 Tax=Paludibaculum fermentans TaxID=1473598 RepID=A0A7S7SM43_PALFE|nr:biotin--[acetyl-CoA-carboxylase] ligase [Paludibaculum fermentans]QOY89121.1 biotin--[acetyl-CoA-carboxylase] ligase [Paludibaculum fermentans]